MSLQDSDDFDCEQGKRPRRWHFSENVSPTPMLDGLLVTGVIVIGGCFLCLAVMAAIRNH